MKTRKWFYPITTALLLALAAVGFGAWAAAAPGAAPSAQIPGAAMAELPEVACVVDTSVTPNVRTCHLWALPGTLTMPDLAPLPVWGFTDGDATTPNGATGLVPGPVIRANVGETLVIVLHNEIVGQVLSLAFPGQEGLIPDTTGVPAGGTTTYSFAVSGPGTFMYEAGLTSGGGRQVAMGLAGPLIVEDGTEPTEVVLVLNEFDPAFNINPANYSMNRFRAKYWLINGQAYPDTGWIDVAAGGTILMRYLNAGVDDHTLGLLGLDQAVIATDGEPLPFPQGAIAPAIAPGQTLDVLVQVPLAAETDTLYPLYNASLHQHNNNQRLPDGQVAFGGMLTYLRVTAGGTPGEAGPVASNVALSPQKTNGTVDVIFSATLTDADLVAAYETFVDSVGAPGTGTVVTVTPAESPFAAFVTFLADDVATWGSGEHILYIRGQDALGAWGTLGSAVLNLDMAGPDIVGLSLAPNPTNGGVNVLLSGTADDRGNGGSNVLTAEYRFDGGAWLPMTLNSPGTPVSGLTATIPAATVAALAEGERLVEVRALDDLGNWSVVNGAIVLRLDKTGPNVPTVTLSPNVLDFNQQLPVTSVRLTATIADPLSNGVQSTVANAQGFLFTQGAYGTGFNLYPSDGLFDEVNETVYYNIPVANFATLPTGDYNILVVGKDKAGNWGVAGSASIHVEAKVVDETGPEITNLLASVSNNGRRFDLTATATDALSNIFSAVWFVGTDPDVTTTYPMSAADGAFNELSEDIRALRIDITSWPAGTYPISVMAIDAAGNWGPVATTSITK
jgi:FtsP/CotA-like multicopper oxidase with cupredoxin domain